MLDHMDLLGTRTFHTLFEILFVNICFSYSNLIKTLFKIDNWELFRSSNLISYFINYWKPCLVFNHFLTTSPLFIAHSKATIFSLCKQSWYAPARIIVLCIILQGAHLFVFLFARLETESLYVSLHHFQVKFSFQRPSQETDPQVFLVYTFIC